MDKKQALGHYAAQVDEMKPQGTYKSERVLTTPQGGRINTDKAQNLINMCANNYLGLCNNPEILAAAKAGCDKWGYGLSSVRFICGTQQVHRQLEDKLAAFLGMEDAILYSSCFDANGGLFETILSAEDAVISDQLNHASIIDGVRLSKAKRYRYANNNMEGLESCLVQANAEGARIKLIATDGVFSMDGTMANLPAICDLADQYGALLMVDDSHAVGFMGKNGAGTPEHWGVQHRVDILTGTLGKALGGASGGYTAARREIVALLRQKSRPYLFSNTLSPMIAAASVKALEILENQPEIREKLQENTQYFRRGMASLGYTIIESTHPIVAVMLYDAALAGRVAARMLELGVYVIGFSFPVVPRGQARIRTQVSAAHSRKDLDQAIAAFAKVKQELGL